MEVAISRPCQTLPARDIGLLTLQYRFWFCALPCGADKPNPMTDSRDTANSAEDAGTTERPGIWNLALPSILGNLSFTLVGLVQTRVVGELGTEALAAVGAGQRIFFLMQAVLMAVSIGTTALVARSWGANDRMEAGRVTSASLVFGCGLALPITLIGFVFAPQLAAAFGLENEAWQLAADNIRWTSVFNLAFAVTIIISAAMRAAGDAWTPLWVSAGINIINIPLLYILAFGYWGLPALGVIGVAVASGLSFCLGGAFLVLLWLSKRIELPAVTDGLMARDRLRRLFDIGYPAGLEQLVIQAGFIGFLVIIGHFYGTAAFAAYNVGVNVLLVAITIGLGFSIASSTLVGQHLGAGDPEGASRAGWRCMGYAVLAMVGIGALSMAQAEPLVLIFVDEPETVELAVSFVYVLGAMMPFMAVDWALAGGLRGAGDTRFPLIATIVGLIIVRLGLAAIATALGLSVVWVYAALMGDYITKAAMLGWRFYRGRWKKVIPA